MNHLLRLCAVVIGCMCLPAQAQVLESKTLKTVSIRPSAAIWQIETDKTDTDGDPEFDLRHVAVDSTTVMVSEFKVFPSALPHVLFWVVFVPTMKLTFKNFTQVALPSGFVVPKDYGCHASQLSLGDKKPTHIHVYCTARKSRTQSMLILAIPIAEQGKVMADVNALLATLGWK
jgi:hypothetical protein